MEKYYVSGCRDDGEATVTCEDSEATFWTLYARDDKGLSQGIIDLAFREDAETALAVYVERDALQEQVQNLAAESDALKTFIQNSCYAFAGDDVDISDSYAPAQESPWFPKTINTDAVIREIGAKAVDLSECRTLWYEHDDLSSEVECIPTKDIKKAIRAAGYKVKP